MQVLSLKLHCKFKIIALDVHVILSLRMQPLPVLIEIKTSIMRQFLNMLSL